MIIKTLTMQNFLSVGNCTQTLNFNRDELVLILGENLDTGGDEAKSRNGAGKCICKNTIVKLRNTKTGKIFETTIGELYDAYTSKLGGKYS
jgi:hypothetical protein